MTKYTYQVTYKLKDGTSSTKSVDATCEGNAAARVIAMTKAVEVTLIEKRG